MSLDLNANKMIIPIVLLGLFKIYAQNNRLETLELGLIPITVNDSIRDYPDATKQQLKKVFANVEIIGLGENTHQDGATFREKTRLIKFLHEEMGFNVLAFESSFYGSWLTNEAYKKRPMNVYGATQSVGSWVKGELSYPVYEYMADSNKSTSPLIIAGFDGEKLPNAQKNIKNLYDEIKKITGFKATPQQDIQIDSLFSGIYMGFAGRSFYESMTQKTKKSAIQIIDTLKTLLGQLDPVIYKNQILFTESILLENHENEDLGLWNMRRDYNMGKRVAWLKNVLYPGEKIILWAASGHLMRNSIGINREEIPFRYEPIYQTGDYIFNVFGNRYYALFFTSSDGFIGQTFPEGHKWKQHEQTEAVRSLISKGSFEDLASGTNQEMFMVDLRSQESNSWLLAKFTAHLLGYNKDTADWHNIVDGIFYIRKMEPNNITR